MAVNGVEIEVGQVWRTRGGRKVAVTGSTNNRAYPWAVGASNYTDNGRLFAVCTCEHDLVELVSPAPATEAPIPVPETTEVPLERRKTESALNVQVGGGHYKNLVIQPVEYCHKNKLGFCESSVIKYVTRWREKGGLKDLQKAKHFIDLLIEMEGGTQ